MDAAIRDRFAKVKALMASPNAGEAAAAKSRYAEMVARYGDPEKVQDGGYKIPNNPPEHFNCRSAGYAGYSFADAFGDLYGASPERRAAAMDVAAAREYGKLCGEAAMYLIDECRLSVDGIVGGPWTIYDELDEPIGPLDQKGVIGYARARGFRG